MQSFTWHKGHFCSEVLGSRSVGKPCAMDCISGCSDDVFSTMLQILGPNGIGFEVREPLARIEKQLSRAWEEAARIQQGEARVGRDGGWEKGQGCREGEALRDSGHQGGQ